MQLFERVKSWFKQDELRRPPHLRQQISPPPIPIKHGTIEITDGQITIHDPEGAGMFPTLIIHPTEPLSVKINGEPASGPVVVSSDQSIEIELSQREPSIDVNVTTSEDLMEVFMTVSIVHGERRTLPDVEEVRKAVLRVHREVIEPTYYSPDELLEMIPKEFIGDIDSDAIHELASSKETIQRVVLRGRHPIPGTPAHYRPETLATEPDPLRLNMNVSTIEIGGLIATFHQRIPSVTGVNVIGKEVLVELEESLPRLGEGVSDIGGRIVAMRPGRVVFTQSRIDVVQEFVMNQGLSPHDGHLIFDGDVVIKGDVLDGSMVRSSGHIIVHGNVMGSLLVAEHGVFIKGNATDTEIVSGANKMTYPPLLETCIDLERELEEFLASCKGASERMITKTGPGAKTHLVPDYLLQHQFRSIPKHLRHFCTFRTPLHDIDKYFRAIYDRITAKWLGIQTTTLQDTDILSLLHQVRDYKMHMRSVILSQKAPIHVSSITSCLLKSSGHIYVTGTGIFSGTLESGDRVVVKGMVRGGSITAERGVYVSELGTAFGAESTVRVKRTRGIIGIRYRHANTVLNVAGNAHRNLLPEQKVRFRVDTIRPLGVAA